MGLEGLVSKHRDPPTAAAALRTGSRSRTERITRLYVDEHALPAVLGLNEAISLSHVEPFYSTDRHVSILPGDQEPQLTATLQRHARSFHAAGSTCERIGINDAPAPRRSEKQLPMN